MTNLVDTKHYTIRAFKALYHARWKIEEGYKRQKSWLEIENFTGKSVLSIRQDYPARILSFNLTSIAILAAELACDLPERTHQYQINFAQALSTMKDTLVKLLYRLVSPEGLRSLLKTLGQSLTIIRPGRSFERKKNSSAHRKFNPCYKRST